MTTILPVLYRYETWSLTLRPKQRLRVFKKKTHRKTSGLKEKK